MWSALLGSGAVWACVPVLVPPLIFFASRRLLAAVELMLRLQHGVVMERERRTTFVEVVQALPAGGAVVQFEAGAPLWAVWVPDSPEGRAALRSAA